jgi:ABC-2 type transport system permease protein
MRLENAFIIGKREYLTRIKTKGFWIATVALPVFMALAAIGPTLLIMKTESKQRIAVVDATGGELGRQLVAALTKPQVLGGRHGEGMVVFDVLLLPPGDPATQRQDLDRRVLRKEIGAWIYLTPEGLVKNRFEYHAESLSNWLTQGVLERRVSEVVAAYRLRQAGFDNEKILNLTQSLDLQPFRISQGGSKAEAGMGGFAVAIGLFLMLYMILIIHGTQIMQGVIEEKSSRVVEVITSAVKPTELMAGKLGGICLLALTQLAIWLGTAFVLSSPGLLAAFMTAPAIPSVAPIVLVHFFFLFLLGFFLFSTLYAMIGACFNSVQEAQQVASVAIFFVVAPMFFFMPVINDPDSKLAVVTSLIPFFTPLVMTLRVASKMPPAWQLAVGYLGSGLTIAFMIWLCSRVYRVGILMYGKKPTLQEIWRWVRYA